MKSIKVICKKKPDSKYKVFEKKSRFSQIPSFQFSCLIPKTYLIPKALMQFRNGHETAPKQSSSNARQWQSHVVSFDVWSTQGVDKSDLLFKDESTWILFPSTFEGQKQTYQMDVSKNSGVPKWMVYNRKPY